MLFYWTSNVYRWRNFEKWRNNKTSYGSNPWPCGSQLAVQPIEPSGQSVVSGCVLHNVMKHACCVVIECYTSWILITNRHCVSQSDGPQRLTSVRTGITHTAHRLVFYEQSNENKSAENASRIFLKSIMQKVPERAVCNYRPHQQL